jgi:hypothetical protein
MRALLLITVCVGASAAFQITPQRRLLVDAYQAAARALGYGRKQIASWLGLSEAQWRKQFEAEDGQHVSLYRIADTPPDVMRTWIKAIGPAYGLRVFDRNDEIVALIDANLAQVTHQRRQQRLPVEQERRRA